MDNSYLAGFIDGDGCICIGKCRKGFQFKVELTQCNQEFLNKINDYFNNIGIIYKDNRKDKYINEQAQQLRICGIKSIPLLNIQKEYGIIKAPQAEIGLEYLEMNREKNMNEERHKLYLKVKSMNADKSSYDKDYSKINNAYIAGLLDAEGNIYYIAEPKKRYYVKITQKSDQQLIANIKKYLTFGQISPSEPYRIRFGSKKDIIKLWDLINDYLIIKKNKYQELINNIS